MGLADTLHRVRRSTGLVSLQRRGLHARELSSWRLCLDARATAEFELGDEETVVVLQRGAGIWRAGDQAWEVDREDVFSGPATALLLPPGIRLEVAATRALEAILIAAPAEPDPGAVPVLIAPEEVEILHRGRGHFRRDVHNLFVSDPHGRRLLVGETFNSAGCWSSFPPHKHDGKNGEPTLEEVYHYRVDPPQGFGLQMLYTRVDAHGAVEEVTHVVHDGDAVVIPYGYHPVSSPPGYRVYYLWALAGDERRLAFYEDPDHRWVAE